MECIKDTQNLDAERNLALLNDEKITKKLVFYLFIKKEKFHKHLLNHLKNAGYDLVFFQEMKALKREMGSNPPAAILLDEPYLDDDALVNFLNERPSQISLLCLATKNNPDIRLKAMHAMVTFFVQKPIEIAYLTNQLIQLCELSIKEDYRILILDGSELLANYYTIFRRGWNECS